MTNAKKNKLSQAEKNSLAFKYVRLAIGRHRGENGNIKTEMAAIRATLGMTHKEIIKEAERLTLS